MGGELEETRTMGSEVQSSLNRKWGAIRFDTGGIMGWEAADPIHTQVLTFENLILNFRNIGYKGGVAQSRSVEVRRTAGKMLKNNLQRSTGPAPE